MRPRHTILPTAAVLMLAAVPAGAQARTADRDHDKMPDRWERAHHLRVNHNDAAGDPDRDGVRNLAEFRAHTDPRLADSDDDGVRDGAEDGDHDGLPNGAEDRTDNDPGDRDSDDDGVRDGQEHSGTVASFTGGVLTVKLADGSTVAATVTAATEIKCEHDGDAEAPKAAAARHGDDDNSGDDGSGSNSGPGSGTSSSGPGAGGSDDQAGLGDHGDDGAAHDQGDGQGDHQDGAAACTTADLVPGAVVHEAELTTTGGAAAWKEIELVK